MEPITMMAAPKNMPQRRPRQSEQGPAMKEPTMLPIVNLEGISPCSKRRRRILVSEWPEIGFHIHSVDNASRRCSLREREMEILPILCIRIDGAHHAPIVAIDSRIEESNKEASIELSKPEKLAIRIIDTHRSDIN